MKIRASYVSNSSSSSFIVLYNAGNVEFKSDNGAKFIFSVPKMIRFIENKNVYASEQTEIMANGKENILEYLKDSGYMTKEELAEYEKMLTDVNYKNCIMFHVSYHDNETMMFLRAMIDSGKVKVVYSSENMEKEEL